MSKSIKLYYDFMSQPSRALWIALKHGQTKFEDCPVALRKGEQLTDEFKKINRFQKVPALGHGDFHLSESIAIIRYLSDKGYLSEKLYPKTVEERARVDEFLEWHHLGLRAPVGGFFANVWLFPSRGLIPKPNAEQFEKLRKDAESSLEMIERMWLNNKFLAGDELTVADLIGAAEIEQIKLCQYHIQDTKFPKTVEWLKQVRAATNPYYDQAHFFINKISSNLPKDAKTQAKI